MQNIFLIGLSGSGKSSVGKALADRLGMPFLDSDALIEAECGERIATLFAREDGEAFFRTCESRILAQITANTEGAVIATGGGAIIRPENRRLLQEHGLRLYLFTEPELALERLQAQHLASTTLGEALEIRPLLAGPDPLARLRRLLQERAAWYEEADFTIPTIGLPLEKVVQACLAVLIGAGAVSTSEIERIVRRVHLAKEYDTVVEWGGLGRLGDYLLDLKLPSRVFLITDSRVGQLYAPAVIRSLQQRGFEPVVYTLPAGEGSKSIAQLGEIYDWLLEQHAERREAIIALGGGVVGDLAGYVAATYLRGVPLIQVPTSLLAQVDAAIGGKTGINHPRGKNLIGAFYHPQLVLADPAVLLTLPERERCEGWAEVIKYGIILDADLFGRLETSAPVLRDFVQPPPALLCELIARCIELKVAIVEEDEREQGRRAILNYGHTFGHALENVAGYGEWLHGEAVSLGMVVAARLALEAGICRMDLVERQERLLISLGLPTRYRGTARSQAILDAMQLDKKVAAKRVYWVMPHQPGEVSVTPLPDELVQRIVTAFLAEKG